MKECSKSIQRRLACPNFARQYFVGEGMDIGGKPDPLCLYRELFPLMKGVRTWDLEDGDAQFLSGVADESYDFIHSSHCLEHLHDASEGLKNWFRVLRAGGHLVVIVPDEDLYEQGRFPSSFNTDHKSSFTIHKTESWSDRSINVLDLAAGLGAAADVRKIELLDATYRYGLPRYDQTMTPIGESGIEFVIRKRTTAELEHRGRQPSDASVPAELRVHFNQYRDDMATLKRANPDHPPFQNDTQL